MKLIAGTYTTKDSKGIYTFELENGKLSEASLLCEVKSSKYLCKYKDKFIALCDGDEKDGVTLFDKDGKILDTCLYERPSSCYVAVKGDKIYTANYHAGTVSLLRIENEKFVFEKTVLLKDKAGCHQVLFHEDQILVPSLFLDKVVIFDEDLHKTGEIVFPEGSGPRHGVFNKDHSRLYLVSELSNELFIINTKDWQIVKQIGLLENGEKNTTGTAAVRLSEDERFLYVSTRGKNVISVIGLDGEIRLLQNIGCGGDHPRDFMLVQGYLLCANRFSDEVVCFGIGENGMITGENDRIRVPEAVCLIGC